MVYKDYPNDTRKREIVAGMPLNLIRSIFVCGWVRIRALERGKLDFDWSQGVQSLAERCIGGWSFGPFLRGETPVAVTVEVLAVETANALQRLDQHE